MSCVAGRWIDAKGLLFCESWGLFCQTLFVKAKKFSQASFYGRNFQFKCIGIMFLCWVGFHLVPFCRVASVRPPKGRKAIKICLTKPLSWHNCWLELWCSVGISGPWKLLSISDHATAHLCVVLTTWIGYLLTSSWTMKPYIYSLDPPPSSLFNSFCHEVWL